MMCLGVADTVILGWMPARQQCLKRCDRCRRVLVVINNLRDLLITSSFQMRPMQMCHTCLTHEIACFRIF
jgi:hypothetical protein